MTGELSQRMQIAGNVWVEVWQSARPVPARRQRRLFDDTKEAEKVTCPCTAQIHSRRTSFCDRRTFLSYARLAADGWSFMSVNRPLQDQLTSRT